MNQKQEGHFYFDKIWKNGLMNRREAYKWLSSILGIKEAHFSELTYEQGKDAIYFCKQALNDNRRLDLDFGVKPITPFYKI